MKRYSLHVYNTERTCRHLPTSNQGTPDLEKVALSTEEPSFADAFSQARETINNSKQPNKIVTDFLGTYSDQINEIARKDVAVSGVYDDDEDYAHHLFICGLKLRMDIYSKLTEGLGTDFHLKPEAQPIATNGVDSAHNLGLAAVTMASGASKDKSGRKSRFTKKLSDTRKFVNGATGVIFSQFKLSVEKQSQKLVDAGLVQHKFSSDESRIDFVAKQLITEEDKLHMQSLLSEFSDTQNKQERSRIRTQLNTVIDKYAKEHGDTKELSKKGRVVFGAAGVALTLVGAFLAAKGYDSLTDKGPKKSGNLIDTMVWGDASPTDRQTFAHGVEAIHEAHPNMENTELNDMVDKTLRLVTKRDQFIGDATGTDGIARGKLFDKNFQRFIKNMNQ